jgi:hypothetical protein
MGRTGRVWHAVLWAVEIIAIVFVALLLMLPIQDYARREHLRWYLHPSVDSWQAFQANNHNLNLIGLF